MTSSVYCKVRPISKERADELAAVSRAQGRRLTPDEVAELQQRFVELFARLEYDVTDAIEMTDATYVTDGPIAARKVRLPGQPAPSA
jgi:hypothetical protein